MFQLLNFLLWLAAILRVGDAANPFENELELERAVDIHLDNDGRLNLLIQTYGLIEDWDVSQISNFGSLFNRERNTKAAFFVADLSRWNMNNARYLHDMFLGAAAFDSDLGGWNVAGVLHFNGLFFGATSFTGRGLENWDVSSGRLFMSMFSSTPSLQDLDIRHWNVGHAEDMRAMFRDSSNFGANMATNNLCGWTTQLRRSVQTRAMFLRSGCPLPSDPRLENVDNGIDFCVRCPPPVADENETIPRPNVLFIITDQQRFDTIRRTQDELSRYENAMKIHTPNLDRLSRKGAYFRMAYCQCSVCAPARTSLRTGCSIERTGIQHNELTHEYRNSPLFTDRVEKLEGLDQILTRLGYVSEYYGKWHMPETLYYRTHGSSSRAVQYNDYEYGSDQFSFRADSWGRKLSRYLTHFERAGNISREIPDGMQRDTYTGFPYTPIEIDSRYGYPTGTTLSTNNGFKNYETTQPNVCGNYSLPGNFTPSHFNGDIAVKALNRLLANDQPFFLTVSFHNPHPPMVPAWKHLEYYWKNRDAMFVPPSIDDKLENADYGQASDVMPKYANETVVKEWTAVYYALIEEIDDYVGDLLDELGDAANNTLIVFTSDHGEMLGAHGKREKNNFFEEASRVPLFFAFQDRIQPETLVNEPVSHLDVVATILDYIGASDEDTSDGKSLRPLIEKTVYNDKYEEDYVVAEWDYRKPLLNNHNELDRRMDERPSLMVRKGQFKLMTQKLATSNKIDMMYDLHSDPHEVYNHLGANSAYATYATLSKAEHLRCLLIEWMGRLDGEARYYSDPLANYGEGQGDIEELRKRQSWPALDFWIGDSSIEIGRLVLQDDQLVRSEFLYMGKRVDGAEILVSITISGPDAAFFSVDRSDLLVRTRKCHSVKITFAASAEVILSRSGVVEASIVVGRDDHSDYLIPLSLGEQDFSEIFPTIEPAAVPNTVLPSVPSEPTPNPSNSSFIFPEEISYSHSKSRGTTNFPSFAPSNAPSKPPGENPGTSIVPDLFDFNEHFNYSHSRSRMGSDSPSSITTGSPPDHSSTPSTSSAPASFRLSTSDAPNLSPSMLQSSDGPSLSAMPSTDPNTSTASSTINDDPSTSSTVATSDGPSLSAFPSRVASGTPISDDPSSFPSDGPSLSPSLGSSGTPIGSGYQSVAPSPFADISRNNDDPSTFPSDAPSLSPSLGSRVTPTGNAEESVAPSTFATSSTINDDPSSFPTVAARDGPSLSASPSLGSSGTPYGNGEPSAFPSTSTPSFTHPEAL
jgi:arylsulfatase A-like enzyme